MASSINASTTSGIVQTADTSGILNLQSNGTTKVAVSSSGVDLTGLSKSSLPTGSVLQVVNATYSTQSSTGSTSFIDTGLTATITPTSATSKILVLVSQNGIYKASNNYIKLNLLRTSTVIVNIEAEFINTGTTTTICAATSTSYLDSPATTSATTYKTQIAMGGAGAGSLIYWCASSATATITLMEIAA